MRTATAVGVLVVGLLIGSFAGRSVGAQAPAARTVPRYQIIANDNLAPTLLDTDTGHTWVRIKFAEFRGEPTVWIFQEKLDTIDAVVAWGLKQPAKP